MSRDAPPTRRVPAVLASGAPQAALRNRQRRCAIGSGVLPMGRGMRAGCLTRQPDGAILAALVARTFGRSSRNVRTYSVGHRIVRDSKAVVAQKPKWCASPRPPGAKGVFRLPYLQRSKGPYLGALYFFRPSFSHISVTQRRTKSRPSPSSFASILAMSTASSAGRPVVVRSSDSNGTSNTSAS